MCFSRVMEGVVCGIRDARELVSILVSNVDTE
jgi:hypothetical protein